MKIAIFAAILIFLLAAPEQASAQTFCVKYAGLLNVTENALITTIVGGTFGIITNATGNRNLRKFFDGSLGTTNFITPGPAQDSLVLHLVQFFSIALGCTGASPATYTGKTFTAAHAAIFPGNDPTKSIKLADFNNFNGAIDDFAASAGVDATDRAAVAAVLASTKCDNAVAGAASSGPACTDPDCGCPAPPPNASVSNVVSFLLVAALLVLAL